MMQILGEAFIPTVEYGGADYGSSFLKSLQTEKLPELDLLVRESIQNSSDASIGINHKNFHIDYTYGKFCSNQLCEQLGEVGQKIASAGLTSDFFLEIRDKKTTGLTGPYNKDNLDENDHGNYFKLIFDTGINQTQQGAGGNWGFGKSVYYRVSGAGVVAFYSRIKEDDIYEDRLIVTMVEDQQSESGVLRGIKNNPTGRAWWGRKGCEANVVWPVIDREEIEAFLDIFGLKPFKEGETGTSVIIPFINEERLLSDIFPDDGVSEDEMKRCIWRNSITEYLEHAIQKWYAPRLQNKDLKELGRKWIRASVNGKVLGVKDAPMNKFFDLVQKLYNVAAYECASKHYCENNPLPFAVESRSIDIRGESLNRENVGFVAFTKIKKKEIFAGRSGISPYTLTGNYDNNEEVNEPIVMFAREPGMVIGYSIETVWSKGVKAPGKNAESSDDEYILAFFVPRVDNAFTDSGDGSRAQLYENLGGYLRKCEDSDHASWEDKAKYKLISKIKNQTGKKIASCVQSNESMIDASASKLAGRVSRALMPGKGYLAETMGDRKKKTGGRKGSTKGARGSFVTDAPYWRNGHIVVPYRLNMGAQTGKRLRVEAQMEKGTLTAENWIRDIGTEFPLTIVRATAAVGDETEGRQDEIEVFSGTQQDSALLIGELALLGQVSPVFRIESHLPNQTVSGELELRSSDKVIECVIKAL